MASSSPETHEESERTATLRALLDRNRKVCQELRESVENCIAKASECEEKASEQPSG